MLSLEAARKRYNEQVSSDHLLIDEHLRRVCSEVEQAIARKDQWAVHELDVFISGPWAPSPIDLVAKEVIQKLKREGYVVSLLSRNPHRLRVSGWVDDHYVESSGSKPEHKPDSIIRSARHGNLSQHLKKVVRFHDRRR